MIPWQLAKQWHDDNVSTETFEENLGWHMSCGVVYSSPDAFIMGREVCWDEERQEISIDESAEKNAWFVELAAVLDGADAFGRFAAMAPRPHKWVLWCRRGEMRVRSFPWSKLNMKVRRK